MMMKVKFCINKMVRRVCLAAVALLLVGRLVAADQEAKPEEDAPKLTTAEQIAKLEQERSGLVQSIRSARDGAMQEQQKKIAADPEMALLQQRIGKLEKELQAARSALVEKMKEAGIKTGTAPQGALDSMARMREIDRNIRSLMVEQQKELAAEAAELERAPATE